MGRKQYQTNPNPNPNPNQESESKHPNPKPQGAPSYPDVRLNQRKPRFHSARDAIHLAFTALLASHCNGMAQGLTRD